MRRSIATVSLSGNLPEKLRAIASARFNALELFENDLINFEGTPRQVRELADDLGLAIDLFQPFRDFEGVAADVFLRNLERAERKFDVMAELGAPMMLVCSNVASQAIDDDERAAAQLHALAERAASRGLRIAYEALAWGTHVRTYGHAWQIVQRACHSHIGLTLDTFHTLALADDPAGIASIPGERIFFLQVADAPRLATNVLSWSRHFRCFPGQGEFDLAGFLVHVLRSGYAGSLSLEVFNDVFRAADARQTALDAMRSLLFLEEQVRARLSIPWSGHADAAPPPPRRVELFDPPPQPSWLGIAFLEFAVDADTSTALGELLERLGFRLAGRHLSKQVTLYRQGLINLILNAEPDSFAAEYFHQHGPSLCALALRTTDELQALGRATALLSTHYEGRVGPNELTIPAVRAIDGSLFYLIGQAAEARGAFFEIDFEPVALDATADRGAGLRSVDHLAMALPAESLDAWLLFYRTVLGLEPHGQLEMAEQYGWMRSRAVADADRSLRITLNVSEGRNSAMARSLSTFSGAGVHHVAFACDDIFATVAHLKEAGVGFLSIPDNYYDDLDARLQPGHVVLEQLRAAGVLYDRTASGEFFHIPTESFAGRFSFELVQRVAEYDGHGEVNAPVYLAAQARANSVD
ncbi:MAG TPA: TIM barrel protein [Chloroflexota bacterium]|nr:TIM barrel protein [Chloroflexota bacterium]